jgi:hypothetical protein
MSILDNFDIDPDRLDVIDQAVAQYRNQDKRICICGHRMASHKEGNKCRPSRFDCPCKKMQAVLEVPDTRFFLSRTTGSGEKHALIRGIYLAEKAMGVKFNQEAKWLVEHRCENPACGKETKLFPVMCDTDLFRIYDSDQDQGVTAFLCEDCRAVYFDSDDAIQAKRAALVQRNRTT